MRSVRLIPLLLLVPTVALAQPHGVNPAYMDTTVSPCSDFFKYANGKWVAAAVIPPSYPNLGVSREIIDRNTEVLHRVLEQAQQNAATTKDPDEQKVGAFYGTCMDSERAEREGLKPIAGYLSAIEAIKTTADLQREVARLHLLAVPAAFRFSPRPDAEQSTMAIGELAQSGLGLPDRDYYIKTDSASAAIRKDYEAHIGRMLVLSGVAEADARAQATRIMALETALAQASMDRVARRDPHATYHKMTVADLSKLAPNWDWAAYFKAVGVPSLASPKANVNVAMPDFFKGLNAQVKATPLTDWKAYLRWHVMHATAPTLTQAISDENFVLTSKLSGVRVQLPRWRRCSAGTDQAIGEALGKSYVSTEFPPAAKARMKEMVNNLQAALRERIGMLPWMSDSTKAQAFRKIDKMIKKIGYPDTWRDYSKLVIKPEDSFATNALRAREFEVRRQLAKIGKTVDRTEWGMTPPTVNAYANPTFNEIVFPAGIMQPPKFDMQADDASNYGSIGSVIGHELTHHFDDEGRKYDADGNLKDWWSADDAKAFTARAEAIASQYDGYVSVDTMHVNGHLTLGENIADLGGLTIAYYAFEKSLEGKPRPPMVDGMTPEQRFFVAFAQGWRNKIRPELLRTITRTDPHSPSFWRVNGVVVNMPEFQKAFGCQDGTPMSPAKRNTIW